MSPAGRRFDQEMAVQLSGEIRPDHHLRSLRGSGSPRDRAPGRSRSSSGITCSLTARLLQSCLSMRRAFNAGVLGHEQSAVDDSFSRGLLEAPPYNAPAVSRLKVPACCFLEIMQKSRGGEREAVKRTRENRPDLLGNSLTTKLACLLRGAKDLAQDNCVFNYLASQSFDCAVPRRLRTRDDSRVVVTQSSQHHAGVDSAESK